MPEAPEVRLVQDYLNSRLPEHSLTHVRIFNKDFLTPETVYHLNEHIGTKLVDIERKGKSLYFTFQNKYNNLLQDFLSGLGMTGSWIITKEKGDLTHCHFELQFGEDNLIGMVRWQYIDPRGFGRFSHEINRHKLGYDVFEWDSNTVSEGWPGEKLLNSRKPIKTLLLDQSFISGIGNYLAAEILFEAKIHPLTKIKQLTREEFLNIFYIAKNLAWKFYQAKGNAFKDFEAPEGQSTGASLLKVYNQKECSICKSNIENIEINNRSSYYCPVCQPQPKEN